MGVFMRDSILEPTRACVARCGATLKIDVHCAGVKCTRRLTEGERSGDDCGVSSLTSNNWENYISNVSKKQG